MADFDACPCSGRTLGKLLQPAVLAVLAREPLHGYRIAEQVAGMAMFHGRRPDPTGVYRALKAMERRGLVASLWDLSKSGPAKRRYRLAPDGRRCLARWVRTLRAYGAAIQELLRTAERAATRGRAPATRRPGARQGRASHG
jgi:DNA-binding PadR family transcriptional regulator